MGRASSSKKVARAANTGGGRTARGSRPLVWYGAIVLVIALGLGGIVFSRAERRDELAAGTAPPVANKDHWHAAYGIYLCDDFAPSMTEDRDPRGIHTHADGLIHIHPFVSSAAGKNATLGVFADAARLNVSDSKLEAPGGKTYTSGKTKCGSTTGIVQVQVNDKVITKDIRNIRFADQDLVTIAFAPKGAKLPPPPTAGDLARLNPQTETIDPPTEITTPGAEGETPTTDPAAGDSASTTSTP